MLALGLRNGIAFPQLIAATDGSIQVIEVAARIPGGQMADLVQHAVGVDLVEVALRFALGEPVTDELAAPKYRQPVAIRFFTAEPGPLPAGKVKAAASLDKVLAAPGVVQAASYIVAGETIRPVKVDGDRRGYVIAVGSTGPGGARARGVGGRASSRSKSSDRVVAAPSISRTTSSCSTRRRPAATVSSSSTASRAPATCCCATTSTCRSTPR